MNIDKIMKDLREILPSENFKSEPETSISIMKGFEMSYGITTQDFINKNYTFDIPETDVDKWINSYETHLLFTGELVI